MRGEGKDFSYVAYISKFMRVCMNIFKHFWLMSVCVHFEDFLLEFCMFEYI